MHAFSVDFVSSLWSVLRAAGTDAGCVYVCCRRGENSAFWLWYSRCACHPPLQPWIVTNAEIPAASVRRDVAERPPGNADKIALKGLLGNVF